MSRRDDLFATKLSKYDSLLWYVSKLYVLDGVLPREDLYQEALIVLDETVEIDEEHIHSEDFARELRNNLKYRLANLRRHHLKEKRDWRKTVPVSGGMDELVDATPTPSTRTPLPRTSTGGTSIMAVFLYAADRETDPGPEEIVTTLEERAHAREFVAELRERVDDTARVVIDQLLQSDDPPDDIIQAYCRVPKHMSLRMLGSLLGWDKSKVKRAVERIRKQARKLQLERETHAHR